MWIYDGVKGEIGGDNQVEHLYDYRCAYEQGMLGNA